MNSHGRPWKCPAPDCMYATLGFTNNKLLYDHQKKHETHDPTSLQSNLMELTDEEVAVLLFELTKAGDVDAVQKLSPQFLRPRVAVWPSLIVAAKMGSLPLLKIINTAAKWPLEDQNFTTYNETLRHSLSHTVILGESVDNFRWLLDTLMTTSVGRQLDGREIRIMRYEYETMVASVLTSPSTELYKIWEDFLMDPQRQLRERDCNGSNDIHQRINEGHHGKEWLKWTELRELLPHYPKVSAAFFPRALSLAKKEERAQQRLMHTWDRIMKEVMYGKPLHPRPLGFCLVYLSRQPPATTSLADKLLKLGAPVNYPRDMSSSASPQYRSSSGLGMEGQRSQQQATLPKDMQNSRGMTALHCASRITSEPAAHWIRFLLEHGADPTLRYGNYPVNEPGAAGIAKWLGKTWDELVKETTLVRSDRKTQQPDLGGSQSDGESAGQSDGSDEPDSLSLEILQNSEAGSDHGRRKRKRKDSRSDTL